MLPTFLFPALAFFGAALILLPPLIHLINMLRHKRVKWAAMDFLLKSHKRNRNYIWLKQLLLLLARMAAILLVVLMLAGVGCTNRLMAFLAGVPTHHYLVVDDSYSMADEGGGGVAFQRAKEAAVRIAQKAGRLEGRHDVTLIRLSAADLALRQEAARQKSPSDATEAAAGADEVEGSDPAASEKGPAPPTIPLEEEDPTAALEAVDFAFEPARQQASMVASTLNELQSSELSPGPISGLRALRQLVSVNPEDRHVVYVFSDFREKDWGTPIELAETVADLPRDRTEFQFVKCVSEDRGNLGIVSLAPERNTVAAGVPFFVQVRVRNYGVDAARDVQVKMRTKFYDPSQEKPGAIETLSPEIESLPAERIAEIRPGETASLRIQAYFPLPGRHVVEVSLPEDVIPADNVRFASIDVPEGERALLIDGGSEREDAYFLQALFQPNFGLGVTSGRARTGIQPDAKPLTYLRDVPAEELASNHTLFLLDVPRLEEKALENVKAFVEGGGGLAIFVGPHTDVGWYATTFYDGGEGLFPLPLAGQGTLGRADENEPADVQPLDHPVFEPFSGERSGLIGFVQVKTFLRPTDGWRPEEGSSTIVAARLRDGSPLVVEKRYGEGRVLAFLTTVAPDWNNWARDPSFVVTALMTQSYLASGRRQVEPLTVGYPFRTTYDASVYLPEAEVVLPTEDEKIRIALPRPGVPDPEAETFRTITLGTDDQGELTQETSRAGVYEVWLTSKTGDVAVRRFAVNVDPDEGATALAGAPALATPLAGNSPRAIAWDDVVAETAERPASHWSQWILLGLILLLLAEQALAYSASYHPARGAVR